MRSRQLTALFRVPDDDPDENQQPIEHRQLYVHHAAASIGTFATKTDFAYAICGIFVKRRQSLPEMRDSFRHFEMKLHVS